MYKYLKIAILSAFLAPPKLYWIVFAVIALLGTLSILSPYLIHLGDYTEAEQQYKVTLGYIVDNGRAIPKQVYYNDGGKRCVIPPKNVTITHYQDGIYDIYARIRRKDGDGYDYIAATAKRVSTTEFKNLKITCGREIIR